MDKQEKRTDEYGLGTDNPQTRGARDNKGSQKNKKCALSAFYEAFEINRIFPDVNRTLDSRWRKV